MLGVVLYSVVASHVVAHPHATLAGSYRWLLAIAVVLYLGGLGVLRFRVARVWSPDRLAAIAIVLLLCAVGGGLDAVVLVGVVGFVLGVAQVARLRGYRRGTAAT